MKALLNDRVVARLFFKNCTIAESTLIIMLASLIWTPLSMGIYAVEGSHLGVVIWMHLVLGIVAGCAVKPFSWIRDFIFMKSPKLFHRYGHHVLDDAMEQHLRRAETLAL
jgi:hypothetical protein